MSHTDVFGNDDGVGQLLQGLGVVAVASAHSVGAPHGVRVSSGLVAGLTVAPPGFCQAVGPMTVLTGMLVIEVFSSSAWSSRSAWCRRGSSARRLRIPLHVGCMAVPDDACKRFTPDLFRPGGCLSRMLGYGRGGQCLL